MFSDKDKSDGRKGEAKGRESGCGEGESSPERRWSQRKGTQEEGGGRRVRPSQEEESSAQNMVVSYLVLIVRLDSLGSTSHVVLPWD